jgi:hypothetical protein
MALLFLLTACGSNGSAGSSERLGTPVTGVPGGTAVTPSGGSSTATIAPTEGAEGAVGRDVVRVYQSWWDAQTEAFGRSDSDGSQLRVYSTGTALSEALANLHQLHQAKLVMTGSPRTAPVVRSLDPAADPQSAVVSDCLDVTDWHQADATTKTLKDPTQRFTRYVATVSLRKNGNRWLIVDFKREVGRTC